jgi:phage shock protein C
MFMGVCGGLAEYLGMDPTLVRLGFVAITAATALVGGAFLYLMMSLVVPRDTDLTEW